MPVIRPTNENAIEQRAVIEEAVHQRRNGHRDVVAGKWSP